MIGHFTVDALGPVSQDGAAMNESDKPFSSTRAGTRIMIELTFDATTMLLHRLRPSHPAGIRVIHVLAKAFTLRVRK